VGALGCDWDCEAPEIPSCAADAAAGRGGAIVRRPAGGVLVRGATTTSWSLAPSERPGTNAEASAVSAAVSAAAAAIVQPRVRRTRVSAASRARTASSRRWRPCACGSARGIDFTFGTDNQLSLRGP
jgi:hypothetical protein